MIMKRDNTVASLLKHCAMVNGAVSIIIAIILNSKYGPLWIIELLAGIIASLLLYAFGEVVQILHDIRKNTFVAPSSYGEVPSSRESLTNKESDKIDEATEKEIAWFQDLYEEGTISQEEFETKKKQLSRL